MPKLVARRFEGAAKRRAAIPADPSPKFVKPQLALLRHEAPAGEGWMHEIKLDGYRIHARIDGRDVRLLTRTGLDWTDRYRATESALRSLKARQAYLDGELCAVGAPYAPGNRGIWVKAKCLNREEFVVVGWTEGEGSRKELGSLLLGYYAGRKLVYAGRAGTGIRQREMQELRARLEPLATDKMPLAEPPPRESRFGRPLELRASIGAARARRRGHLPYLDRGLLRQVVFQGLSEHKRASEVRLECADVETIAGGRPEDGG